MNEFSPAWLRLREPADAEARATDLLDPIRRYLADRASPLVIYDLGCGTGSMGRWLAPRLPGPQHWVMYDHDRRLLDLAAAGMVTTSADGGPVTVETRRADLAALTGADLAGAGLIVASALLDVFTRVELARVVEATLASGAPALFTLSVRGEVRLSPPDPLDPSVSAAFNDHQRRERDGHRLLGPDAVDAAVAEFTSRGAQVHTSPSPWRLGPERSKLIAQWLEGWVDAACEQEPSLAGPATGYRRRRLAAATAGRLRAEIAHADLLAYPAGSFAYPAGEPPTRSDT